MTKKVSISIIDAFDGPRHRRLKKIWQAFSLLQKDLCELHLVENREAELDHRTMLKVIWDEELQRDSRFAIITEMDFLPDFSNFFSPLHHTPCSVVAAQYANGLESEARFKRWDFPGVWYLFIDKVKIRDLDFTVSGPCNDPGNGLWEYLEKFYPDEGRQLLPARTGLPEYHGARYFVGEHLFWSRHYNDPPDTHLHKEVITVGDILRGHDVAVGRWLSDSPQEFKEILSDRGLEAETLCN